MRKLLALAPLLGTLCLASPSMTTTSEIAESWRFSLASPGGELPFRVSFTEDAGTLKAAIHNGTEVIEAGHAELDGKQLAIHLAPYDSELRAEISADGQTLHGRWSKSLGGTRTASLELSGRSTKVKRFQTSAITPAQQARLDGRWSVQFKSDENLSIGSFVSFPDGRVHGTFETTLGDYRFLAGSFDGERMQLSCFDGGHAFLFKAKLNGDGSMTGDFWSRDSWHETWTAHKDPNAKLPDSFGLTSWNDEANLEELIFPDLEGKPRSLADPAYSGRARIITLFGTWCPNCNDEARFLAELEALYGKRGLSVLGLAFELDVDFDRSVRQVRRFMERHGAKYPVLIAAEANKAKASKAFSALDSVRAYPTAIFLDRNNKVRAVHTGFSGPATGAAHDHMRERYTRLLEQLLAE